ncbi:MAG: CRTAC1 family protein [Sumerlaeia bacterium]
MRVPVIIIVAVSLATGGASGLGDAEVQFTNVTSEVFSFPVSANTQSVSLADVDNDGDLDLLYQGNVSGTPGRRFYRNQLRPSGLLSFVDETANGPLANDTTGWSAAWADVNGDGFVDVFLGQSNTGPGVAGDLFFNQGGTGFTDVSATTINDPGFHQNVAWVDMNNDELLDLLFGMEGPEKHELYLQGPGLTFTPVGEQVGIQIPFGTKSYGMAVGDADNDGDMDFYISTCRAGGDIRNNFFRNNLIGTGTLDFTDVADENGTQYLGNSYHAEFQDFDDDGWLDLFMVGADGNPSKIWRNNQDGTFTDVDTLLGRAVFSTNGGDLNGGKAVDYDNDGDLDIFFHDHTHNSQINTARYLFRNDGNWNFVDVTSQVGLFNTQERAYDSAWGDVDLDGDMDLVTAAQGGYTKRIFLSNAAESSNAWSQIRLTGAAWNTRAVGATVYATIHKGTPNERRLMRLANTNAGTFNQSDLPVHFGLGSATMIDELEVHWTASTVEKFYNLPVNEYLFITQGLGEIDVFDGWAMY